MWIILHLVAYIYLQPPKLCNNETRYISFVLSHAFLLLIIKTMYVYTPKCNILLWKSKQWSQNKLAIVWLGLEQRLASSMLYMSGKKIFSAVGLQGRFSLSFGVTSLLEVVQMEFIIWRLLRRVAYHVRNQMVRSDWKKQDHLFFGFIF
jgi:hypothetical protein